MVPFKDHETTTLWVSDVPCIMFTSTITHHSHVCTCVVTFVNIYWYIVFNKQYCKLAIDGIILIEMQQYGSIPYCTFPLNEV